MLVDYSVLSESKKELLGQARYGFWLTSFQSKFYSRVGILCNFLQVVLGSAVFATGGKGAVLTVLIGAVIAIVGGIQLVMPCGELAERAAIAHAGFLKFEDRLVELDEVQAVKALSDLQNTGINSWQGMDVLAFNRVCDWHKSPEEKMPELLSSKFFKLFL